MDILIQRTINVQTQFEGFHKYDNAPAEVEFLKYPHRHIFYVDISIEVFHDDRELEFIMVKRMIEDYIKSTYQPESTGEMVLLGSCEMIAEDILVLLIESFGSSRAYSVCVSEDGENGACVTI